MLAPWNGWLVVPLLAVVAVGALMWKKRRVYHKVGHVSKILFFPMKGIQGMEVKEGKCTMTGLEVNGLLERSFMLVDKERNHVTLLMAPKLAQLTSKFSGQNLIISGPGVDPLTIKLEANPSPNDEIIECRMLGELAYVVDCGNNVAKWFSEFLNMPNVRLVRHFPNLPKRKYVKDHPFYQSIRSKYSVSLQNLTAFHVLSQPSIDDLNERLGEKKVSVSNFRPNVLVDGCEPYAEDKWKIMKFGTGVEILNLTPSTRCLLTTYDPEVGIVTQKEPLETLRKYRIPKDKAVLKNLGQRACLGIRCSTLKPGSVKLNDDVYAIVN